MCVCVCVCVRARVRALVSVFNTSQHRNIHLTERHHRHTWAAILRCRDYMKALQSAYARGLASMHARVSAHNYKPIYRRTHDTDKSRAIHQHAQSLLHWCLWIVFLVLRVGMLPNSCKGARARKCTPPISAAHEPCLICFKRRPSHCDLSVLPLRTLQFGPTAVPYCSVVAAIQRGAPRRG